MAVLCVCVCVIVGYPLKTLSILIFDKKIKTLQTVEKMLSVNTHKSTFDDDERRFTHSSWMIHNPLICYPLQPLLIMDPVNNLFCPFFKSLFYSSLLLLFSRLNAEF
jgi:hypothetical protein